jgi:glutathione S-transferase
VYILADVTIHAGIKTASVPFFIRPVTNGVANKISSFFLQRNFKTHYDFLESQLKSSPDGGPYLCGKDLSAADILMSFPLEVGKGLSGMNKEQYPLIWSYVDKCYEHESYKRSVRKIEEIEGSFKSRL